MAPNFLVPIVTAELKARLLNIVAAAFGRPDLMDRVPVDNPVSLDRDNLARLGEERYTVALKADGTRYVLVLCMYKHHDRELPIAAMVDRRGNMFQLEVHAPDVHFENTSVFDGELCEVRGSPGVYDYLVFNALVNQGTPLHAKPYDPTRLGAVQHNFHTDPLPHNVRADFKNYIHAESPWLNLVRKEHDDARRLRELRANRERRYGDDGYIFTPAHRPVRAGQDEMLLKYKTDQNPIDVLVTVDAWNNVRLMVGDRGELVDLKDALECAVYFDPNESPQFCRVHQGAVVHHRLFGGELFRQIVEMGCQYDDLVGLKLSYIRLRPDKAEPNDANTVRRTLRTIRDDITEDDILGVIHDAEKRAAANRVTQVGVGPLHHRFLNSGPPASIPE